MPRLVACRLQVDNNREASSGSERGVKIAGRASIETLDLSSLGMGIIMHGE
jgi:hypothetical protein